MEATLKPASSTASALPEQEVVQVDTKDVRRIATAAFAGTALEWYDFFLYGTAAALVFDKLFFDGLGAGAATLASLASFGVGVLACPFGAVLFGWLGDRFGRKPALLASITVIGVATGIIGLLPTSASIGLAAPILLTLLRLLQGVAVGGEWGGATTMAIEHAPAEKRGRYAAMVQLGSPAGTLLSSGAFSLVLLMPSESFDSWGWRLPFLAAFPLLGIVVWLRLKVEESPVYKKLAEEEAASEKSFPAKEVFQNASKSLLVAVAASIIGIGGFFIITTYAISYATTVLGVARQDIVNATLVGAVCEVFILIGFGRLSEKIGPGRVLGWGGVASLILSWPIWLLIETASVPLVILGISIGISVISIPYAVTGTLLGELFPAKYRYSGVSIGYNISNAIGGFMPFIATALTSAIAPGSYWPAALLFAIMSLITAWAGFTGEKLRVQDDLVLSEAK